MKCDICERTDLECNIRKVNGMYLCPKHLTQYYRYGYFLENTIYDENLYIIDGDICKIELRDKYCNVVDYAIIDIDDIQICKQYKWHIKYGGSTNYAIASNENKKIAENIARENEERRIEEEAMQDMQMYEEMYGENEVAEDIPLY